MKKTNLIIQKGSVKVELGFEYPISVSTLNIRVQNFASCRFPIGKLKEDNVNYRNGAQLPANRIFDTDKIKLPFSKSANNTALDFIKGKYFKRQLWKKVSGFLNDTPLVFKIRTYDVIIENLVYFLTIGGDYQDFKILDDTLTELTKKAVYASQNTKALFEFLELDSNIIEE